MKNTCGPIRVMDGSFEKLLGMNLTYRAPVMYANVGLKVILKRCTYGLISSRLVFDSRVLTSQDSRIAWLHVARTHQNYQRT